MKHALVHWVQAGVAPTSLLAKEHKNPADNSSDVILTRPLCPYPKTAHYKGIGDTTNASNFECRQ
jgi:feruloyl esterase